MTVPVPYTWTDDEVATASLFNANIRDPQSWLLGLPVFYGRNNVNQNIPSNGSVYVQMNVEEIKRGFTHAANDTKVYATEPGWYRYVVNANTTQTTYGNTDSRGAWLQVNHTGTSSVGGVYTAHSYTATIDNYLGGRGGYIYLNGTTDYVEVLQYQSSPSTDCTTWGTTLQLFWTGRDA